MADAVVARPDQVSLGMSAGVVDHERVNGAVAAYGGASSALG
ncbi:hypothetical protein ACQP06_12935 [Nocardia sp. CA-136227]